jgi:PilZ domain
MTLPDPFWGVKVQKAHTLLDQRYAERIKMWNRISYSGQVGARSVTGEAILKDLSKTGCRLLGPAPSPQGSLLTLLLDPKDGQGTMRITEALISRVAKDSFAIKFPRLLPEDRKRLQEMILKNISLSSLEDHRTAFRIL